MSVKHQYKTFFLFNFIFKQYVIIFIIAYITRHYGEILVPLGFFKNGLSGAWMPVDLWRYAMGNGKPSTPSYLFIENFTIWFIFYGVSHFITYVEPQRNLFRPFKFNENYPKPSLILTEIFRSARGLTICTIYEIVVNNLHANQSLPMEHFKDTFISNIHSENDGILDINILSFTFVFILSFTWMDFHFYWTHRLLHTKWFYKRFHKDHHQSFNPDPFSGMYCHAIFNILHLLLIY